MYSQKQAGFLTRALPQDSFPSGTGLQLWTVDKTSLGFSPASSWRKTKAGETGAHSGATVADLNRVPIFVSRDQTPRNLQLGHLSFQRAKAGYRAVTIKSTEKSQILADDRCKSAAIPWKSRENSTMAGEDFRLCAWGPSSAIVN